jgi:hypothetical protein
MRRRCLVAWLLMVPALASAQTLVDKTRVIVAGHVIMDSDITVARQLRLLPPAITTDAGIQTELENRVLMLADIGATSLAAPTDAEVAARRAEWERSLGFGGSVPELLKDVHLSDGELTAWLRDDVRIQKYERDRFGREASPEAAMNRWILDLRRRAGLR